MKAVLFNLMFLPFAASALAENIILDDSIPPGANYQVAAFRLWYNSNGRTLRGVIVLVPGSNGDGRDMTNDPEWQHLAEKYNFALLGCYFTDHPHGNMDIEEYVNVKEGSGDALLNALTSFGTKSGHQELSTLPLLFWGMSAGGEFNYEFACWKPERTIAFVVNKGGIYYTDLAPSETRKVPAIFFTGQNDIAFRSEVIRGIFSANRRFGALWTFIEEPGTAHEFNKSKQIAEIFFDEIIPLRLTGMAVSEKGVVPLNPLQEKDGFIGDLKTFNTDTYGDGPVSDYPASWLLNARIAAAWQKCMKGQPVE